MDKLLLTLTDAAATAATTTAAVAGEEMGAVGTAGALIGSLFPLILMFVIFYFMLIRPQRKKDKQVKQMLDSLKPGDRVTTIGGIYGTIMGIKDDTITLAVGAARTEMVFARWAIRGVEEVTVENDGEQLA